MKDKDGENLRKRARRIAKNLGRRPWTSESPLLSKRRPTYEVADRVRATKAGGVGAIHTLVRRLGLPERIDSSLSLLKCHRPYHESDHVLSLAYMILGGGQRLQDLELLREDEAFLDMLDAPRVPDPTTAGDFLRRFSPECVDQLQELVNRVRVDLWRAQSSEFTRQAIVDVDGVVVGTAGEKKEGMDFNYHKKTWGYHPLLVSLANTREPLFIVNRKGNVPSHAGSAQVIDRVIALLQPVFQSVRLRGDTDFSLTEHLDRWAAQGVRFVFGFNAMPNLRALADEVPANQWQRLEREPKHVVRTMPRARRDNVREGIVEENNWKNVVLEHEDIAEIKYKPVKCDKPYRMVILRKLLAEKRGQKKLFEEYRYFFYITNDSDLSTAGVVYESNSRCDQENLIEQLKHGVHALRGPAHDLVSNGAYMAIAALAWTFKAWFGLSLPRTKDRLAIVRMEFRRFLNTVVLIPAQVVRQARRVIVRLLAYTAQARLLLHCLRLPLPSS